MENQIFDCGPAYYTPSQFARKFNLGAQTVREMCARKEIPGAFRVSDNGRWRIPMASEKEFVRTRQGAQEPKKVTAEETPVERAKTIAAIGKHFRKLGKREVGAKYIQEILDHRRSCAEIRTEIGIELPASKPYWRPKKDSPSPK
jgi:hypothetical protein